MSRSFLTSSWLYRLLSLELLREWYTSLLWRTEWSGGSDFVIRRRLLINGPHSSLKKISLRSLLRFLSFLGYTSKNPVVSLLLHYLICGYTTETLWTPCKLTYMWNSLIELLVSEYSFLTSISEMTVVVTQKYGRVVLKETDWVGTILSLFSVQVCYTVQGRSGVKWPTPQSRNGCNLIT